MSLAARLEQAGQADSVLVSEATRQAIAYPCLVGERAAALGRALVAVGDEADARAAYRAGLDALGPTLPRTPDRRLADTLRESEPVARLREEAGALGAAD